MSYYIQQYSSTYSSSQVRLVRTRFYIEISVGVWVNRCGMWGNLSLFSILTRVLNNVLYNFCSTFGGLGWGFHTVRGGIKPGYFRFRCPVVGVVDAWKDFRVGEGPYLPRGSLALCTSPKQ